MQVVNLAQKFDAFQDYFNPKIVGELNNFQVKLVKVQGESCGTTMTRKTRCLW
jgi:hypothetical protein